ncbi:MAG: hypothetical protein U0905_15940 [Pirellulales bacterium]
MNNLPFIVILALILSLTNVGKVDALQAADGLWAGTAKIDITHPQATRVHDPCFAKALVLKQDQTLAAIITIDAVAIGGIGSIRNTFLETIRTELARDPGIPASNVFVNASHCHGQVNPDSEESVIATVRTAFKQMEPVTAGVVSTEESRISENRRVWLKDGTQVDMRRAYPMAWDEQIASVGPIDPQVGIVKLARKDHSTLAVIYNFACHPIMNPPSKGSSADLTGVASNLIETALARENAMAFFIQGCGGDINPVHYKNSDRLPDAEPLGHLLGSTILNALAKIETKESSLVVRRRWLSLPRAADFQSRIESLESQRSRLVESLKPTNIQFKQFLPLLIQQRFDPEYPTQNAQAYLHAKQQNDPSIAMQDAENKGQIEAYLANLQSMEQITRLNTNLALLKMHQAKAEQALHANLDCELGGLRIGSFRLITFPGELTSEIGINIKRRSPAGTFVAGYTNGYIHYLPTLEQRQNKGFAQEDCDCMVAPEWQRLFEEAARQLIQSLQ